MTALLYQRLEETRAVAVFAVIRVALPQHLRTLAGVDREVLLDVEEPPTQRAVLDALEAGYPVLRGTIRDHATAERRAFVRFFACGRTSRTSARTTPCRKTLRREQNRSASWRDRRRIGGDVAVYASPKSSVRLQQPYRGQACALTSDHASQARTA